MWVPLAVWVAASLAVFPFQTDPLRTCLLPLLIGVETFSLVWIAEASEWTVPKSLAKGTFFVFAAHWMMLGTLAGVLPRLVPLRILRMGASAPYFALLFAGTLAACFGLAVLCDRLCPPLAALLSGGRSVRSRPPSSERKKGAQT